MKRSLSNVFFFVKQTQRNKARKNNKKTRKEKIDKKTRKKQKNKKQDRERQRVKKEKWKKPRRKKGRHWEMNKITRFQGKNSVFIKKQKTQNTKKGWRPTASKHTCRFFFVVPLVYSWSCIVFVYLVHCKNVTHLVLFTFGVLCFFFLVVVFRLLFPFLSFLCSLFLILLFMFLHFSLCDQKTRSNHRISEMFILMFCFGACILAFSLGPAKNPY